MSLFKGLFGKKDAPVSTNQEFWQWFTEHEQDFYNVVKRNGNIEKDFFNKLSPKLGELKDGYFYLTGMHQDNVAELVITADGNIKNFVFVQELVAAAPKMDRWRITALKQALDPRAISIKMGPYEFNEETLDFYAREDTAHPDSINIVIVPQTYNETDKDQIYKVIYILLDNYLGELDLVKNIDILDVAPNGGGRELIPLSKLKDYLTWRQKEFVEKYNGKSYDTQNDQYTMVEAELENGEPLIAVINADLLKWDSKASHPWIAALEISYKGPNGLPDKETFELLQKIEDDIAEQLRDTDGYLNIGRQTAANVRELYYACNEFYKVSKVLYQVSQRYKKEVSIDYRISKDKYWQQFEHFMDIRQ